MSNDSIKYQTSEYEKGISVIKLGKSVLGGNEAFGFTSTLHELIEKNVKTVIVDLGAVELMNSSGLGMLVNGLITLRKHGIPLNLVAVPEKVVELLEITHLNQVFKSFTTVMEAAEAE